MRLVDRPRAWLIASTALQAGNLAAALDYLGHDGSKYVNDALTIADVDLLPESAGRVCYDSFTNRRPGGNHAYLDRIKDQGHGSVLEASNFSFLITDISRGCSHELVRHRAGVAVSMRSTRFVDESEAGVVVPPLLRGLPPDHSAVAAFRSLVEASVDSYRQMMEYLDPEVTGESTERRKALRQTARSVLPTALVTTLVWTANARALRHFLEMRASPHADPEIRQLAVLLYDLVSHYELFSDYRKVTLPDGSHALETDWRKV